MADVADIANRAVATAETKKNATLGVTLTAPFELKPDVESALSNLMTEAVLDSFDADIAIHNVFGGIRNGLPAGDLTFGDVYGMFPFDNLVTKSAALPCVQSSPARQRCGASRDLPGCAPLSAAIPTAWTSP